VGIVMKPRYIAIAFTGVAVGVAVALLIVGRDGRSPQIDVQSVSSATPGKSSEAIVSYSISLAPDASKSSRILSLKKMGTFSARCEKGRVQIKFVAGPTQTVLITAAPAGGDVSSANVDPGKSFEPAPASSSSSYATWRASDFSEAFIGVATIGFASQPAPDDGCLMTMQGAIQRRQRGQGIGASG
jgi:hypothetical protein